MTVEQEPFTRLVPRWQHDCDHCRLVAVIHVADGVTYDVYVHENSWVSHTEDGVTTVVARFGDEGPEYLSATPVLVIRLDGLPVELGPFDREDS